MLGRVLFRRAVINKPVVVQGPLLATGIQSVRFNSSFDQLKNAMSNATNKSSKEGKSENFSAIETIDSLLKDSPNPGHGSGGSDANNIFENSVPHPRDVAKNIRLHNPIAGRTVDVHYGNLSWALNNLNALIRNNKIRYLKKVQARYIPRAKYAKQRKREWWRKQFSRGFKDLMAQVRDAKRRGY